MEIKNPKVLEDIAGARPLRVNIGCGRRHRAGFYGLDLLPLPEVDIQADLNQPLDKLPDNSVAEVMTEHTLEHIVNFIPLLSELHRVVQPGGTIKITVPHFSSPLAYSDPTHVRFFGLYTMFYFADQDHAYRRKVLNFYTSIRFKVLRIHLKFSRAGFDKILGGPKEWMFNLNPRWQALFERHFCWISPAEEIIYTLTPVK